MAGMRRREIMDKDTYGVIGKARRRLSGRTHLSKKKTRKRAFFRSKPRSVAFATKDAEQGQQALEHIDDVKVQSQSCTYVVGFATINDLFDVI